MTKALALVLAPVVLLCGLAMVASGPGVLDGQPVPRPPTGIDPTAFTAYLDAAATCPGLTWPVLAAIADIAGPSHPHLEPTTGNLTPAWSGPARDGNDRHPAITASSSPDGWTHPAGPLGLRPDTWTRWRPTASLSRAPSIANIGDAALTAARALCGPDGTITDLTVSLTRIDADPTFADRVLTRALTYVASSTATSTPLGTVTGDTGRRALAIAATQIGVPYIFGAATPGVGFDCSGLIWWTYRQVGVAMPRISFDQAAFGEAVNIADLRPGDLVFTRGGDPARDLGHVSLYAGDGQVLTAPHTGASVTYRPLELTSVQIVRRAPVTGQPSRSR